jgi:CRP-like cAMP-binding protein
MINELEKGDIFGEICLITNLKRTAKAISVNQSTLSYLSRDKLNEAKNEYPNIFKLLKNKMQNYDNDPNMKLRLMMTKNIPYFRKLDQNLIREIVFNVRPKRYEPG